MREADLLIVIGERLGEMTTSGYTLLEVPSPRQALVHVHPGPEEARPRLPAGGRRSARRRARSSTRCSPRAHRPPPVPWAATAEAAHRDYEAWRAPRPVPGAVDLWQIVRWLDERLPDDTIITNGAGNYTTWIHRLYRYPASGHAARALRGRDGLRRARGGRRQAPAARRRR